MHTVVPIRDLARETVRSSDVTEYTLSDAELAQYRTMPVSLDPKDVVMAKRAKALRERTRGRKPRFVYL